MHKPKVICLLAVNVVIFICSNVIRRCVGDVTQLPSAASRTGERKREFCCEGPLVSQNSHHSVAPDVLDAAER